jgi:hypothetical protein
MASPQGSMKLFSRNKIQMWDHDPDGTSAAVVTPDAGTTERWVDMRDYGCFAAIAMSSTLTGNGISLLEIVAADDTSGTNVTVIKTSGAVVCDAVGDYVVEECTAEEVRQESEDGGYALRYVAARLTVANAADEAVVTYIRSEPRFATSGLTADTIS